METIIEYIRNPELISPKFFIIWQVLRVVFLLISAFFIGLLIFLFFVSDYKNYRFFENYSEFKKAKPKMGVKMEENWSEIVKQAKSERESDRKIAVIEADDIIDDVLAQLGYSGDSLVEKLERINEEIIPNLEEIKEAHKKRKEISYDPNKSLSIQEAEKLVSVYEKTFKDLQVI